MCVYIYEMSFVSRTLGSAFLMSCCVTVL